MDGVIDFLLKESRSFHSKRLGACRLLAMRRRLQGVVGGLYFAWISKLRLVFLVQLSKGAVRHMAPELRRSYDA